MTARPALGRRAVLLGLPLLAAGCAGTSIRAPDEALARVRYRDPGPTSLALITVRNEGSGDGAHTAVMISASERVLFDPYGGWSDPSVPERDDVLFGFSPAVEAAYLAYQAGGGYYYVRQEKVVDPAVAEMALEAAKVRGPVGMAQCTLAAADVLRLPGFEGLGRPLLPNSLQARFARLPGVTTTERHGAVPIGADS